MQIRLRIFELTDIKCLNNFCTVFLNAVFECSVLDVQVLHIF